MSDAAPPFATATVTLAISDFAPPTCTATIVAATCDPQIKVTFTPEKVTFWLPKGGVPAPVRVNFVLSNPTAPYAFAGFYFPAGNSGQQFQVKAISAAQVVVSNLCNPAKMRVAYQFKGLIQNTQTGEIATFDPAIEDDDRLPPTNP